MSCGPGPSPSAATCTRGRYKAKSAGSRPERAAPMPDRAASESAPHSAAAGLHGPIRPSRVRYRILALLCGLSMITYLDRACLGAAAPSLVADLSLTSEAELKWAFAAFAIAYALFEIPAGWLGDVLGP